MTLLLSLYFACCVAFASAGMVNLTLNILFLLKEVFLFLVCYAIFQQNEAMMDNLREVCPLSGPPPLAVFIMQQFFSTNVNVSRADYLGRPALKVAFTDEYQKNYAINGVVQANAYVRIPLTYFYEGTIEVDIAAERNSYADEFSRAFAGVAFRLQPDINKETYDVVYLRMTNGLLSNPPPPEPRNVRAIQYISPPNWHFDTLREQFPGQYEAGAKIAEKRWNHLRITVKNNTASVFIDYDPKAVLSVSMLGTRSPGPIAFWVDDATTAYFSNLQIY